VLGRGDHSQADELIEAELEDISSEGQANHVTDEAAAQRQPPAKSWTRVLRELEIDAFRPLQMEALDRIEEAFRLAEKDQRLTTAAVVIPTGAGKDLLPLGWSFFRSGVSIMFVPFKHLAMDASQYCKQFNGKAEVFDRGMTNTAANLLLCAYEQASYVVPLVQNLAARRRLAGTFVNECQVLALDSTWREFEPMSEFFGLLTSHGIVCPVVFMTATLRHPETVLEFCGLSPSFDTELFVSPMRQNLTFQQFFFPEGVDSPSSHALMMDAACSAIEGRAMAKRVVIFAMYKFQFCGIVSWLTKKFPGRSIVTYDRENRSDLSALANDAIVVATSALQTGTNIPRLDLTINYGYAYSPEGLLQAGGRAARTEEQIGVALLLRTPYSTDLALRIGKDAQSLKDVQVLCESKVMKLHEGLEAMFQPPQAKPRNPHRDFPPHLQQQQAAVLADDSTQPRRPQACHADVHAIRQALLVNAADVKLIGVMRVFCFAVTLAQDQKNLPSCKQDRCFKCRSSAHRNADCPLTYDVCVAFVLQRLFPLESASPLLLQDNIKTVLMKHLCCCNCGLPVKVNGVELHGPNIGKLCRTTTFFLNKLCEDADVQGIEPHLHVRQLLSRGIPSLISAYASFVPNKSATLLPVEQQKRQRLSQQQEQQQQQQQQHQPQRMLGQQGFGQQMQGQQGFGGQGMGGMQGQQGFGGQGMEGMQGQQGFGGQGMEGMQMGGRRPQMQGMQGGTGMVRLHCLLFDHFCLLMTACRARTWWAEAWA